MPTASDIVCFFVFVFFKERLTSTEEARGGQLSILTYLQYLYIGGGVFFILLLIITTLLSEVSIYPTNNDFTYHLLT